MSQLFKGFVDALTRLGFGVLHLEDNQAVVRSDEIGATFVVSASGEWLQAAQTLIDGEDMVDDSRSSIADLGMRINSRFLGCRFAFDNDGSLSAIVDIYPGSSAEHGRIALAQLAYVAHAAMPLFAEVGQVEVDDQRIELAFRQRPEN